MDLKTTIDQEIKTAMKAKNQAVLRTLRAIKSAILIAETAEGRSHGPLTDTEALQLLTKQAKQRKDSLEQFTKNGRDDLAIIESEELEIIEGFLPKQLSEDELKAELEKIMAETGASSMKDMGKVMGLATQRLTGKADGKVIAGMVRNLLS